MGASRSTASDNQHVHRHQRRPSKHSGKLYHGNNNIQKRKSTLGMVKASSAPNLTVKPTSMDRSVLHIPMASADCLYQTTEELKSHLPADFQPYSSGIEIVYRYWRREVEALNEEAYTDLALALYTNSFQLFPSAQDLFAKDMTVQAKQFLGKFRWLILNLREPDTQRLIKSIRKLGKHHSRLGIKHEWYPILLKALHQTLHDASKDRYTSRVRFCFEQLYTFLDVYNKTYTVANIMTGQDFASLSSEKISNLLKSLGTLQDCLDDEEGIEYLELFMSQQFCVELILFYKDYRRFKTCMSDEQRQAMGKEIMGKYIVPGPFAECQINISYGQRADIYEVLNENDGVFVNELFDEAWTECKQLIQLNIWQGFKQSILQMAVDADLHYEEKKNARLSLCPSPLPDLPSMSLSPSMSFTANIDSPIDETPAYEPKLQSKGSSNHLRRFRYRDGHDAETNDSKFQFDK